MSIGDRIKSRREQLNMSQDELAKKLGYKSRSSINKIEKDGRGLPQSKIKAIADALFTTPAYIMGWLEEWDDKFNSNGELAKSVKLLETIQSTYGYDAVQLLDLFTKLNEQGKQKALENLSDLVEIPKYSSSR